MDFFLSALQIFLGNLWRGWDHTFGVLIYREKLFFGFHQVDSIFGTVGNTGGSKTMVGMALCPGMWTHLILL